MRYKIDIYSSNVAIHLAGVDRHFSDDERSGAIAHRGAIGQQRADAWENGHAGNFALCQSDNGRIG